MSNRRLVSTVIALVVRPSRFARWNGVVSATLQSSIAMMGFSSVGRG